MGRDGIVAHVLHGLGDAVLVVRRKVSLCSLIVADGFGMIGMLKGKYCCACARLLHENAPQLTQVAEFLLENETMDRAQFEAMMRGEPV